MGIAIGIGYAQIEKSYYVAACFCISNSIISLHHFYTILVWGYMEIYEIMIWLVMGKTHWNQALLEYMERYWDMELGESPSIPNFIYFKTPLLYYIFIKRDQHP